ncbi:protein shisa-5 isoform X2 [Protopterus annectens]|uniref:protein shisa-5 isoform X2 n=1 Tax=Protopterus annectens TaxID=7888 RepID=UPI001CFBB85B|nr:protein shisa-5 isoform X2 [Protopterus annectens]
MDYKGYHPEEKCYAFSFCCGDCDSRYCCSNLFSSFPEEQQRLCFVKGSMGTFIAVGVTIFVLFVVGIIICFTCSCCCLYKACRGSPQPRPIVAASTTTVQVQYPQQPVAPQAYQVGPYHGYQPVPAHATPVHPGVPTPQYPAQYPGGYPQQMPGPPPPPYQEAVLNTSGLPYPTAPNNPNAAVPPPYNPAYMEPQKSAY